ncbi:hypothetical protein RHMOL_Rhmol03G0184100 [Rhododendron molle]|uniref:Uncharacterized protein n=1 Tax=Rhododendron molle TaxID=49168 RepID=A0ACC0PIZ0_RHOML|nr:hypothetical protein RHMOL_Rhmol03G0184100 [Rhododendron molle]
MYKTELNSLGQRKSWDLPNYSTKCGPDHALSFTATTTVSGVLFTTVDDSTTLKEAENKCAKITLNHFSHVSTSSSLYKNCLQDYAGKRNLPLFEYSIKYEGPPYAIRFKSTIKIDGKPYWSPEFFPTIKEAKDAAAKVTLKSLSINEVQEDDSDAAPNRRGMGFGGRLLMDALGGGGMSFNGRLPMDAWSGGGMGFDGRLPVDAWSGGGMGFDDIFCQFEGFEELRLVSKESRHIGVAICL